MFFSYLRFLCWEVSVGSVPCFLIGFFGLTVSRFLNYLYILDISTLSDVGLVKIFSQSVGCCFVLMTVSFDLQKLFSFMRSHLLILDLSAWAIGVLFRKLSPVLMSSGLLPTFFLLDLVYLVLSWGLWSTWTWVLCRVIDMDLFPFFYIETFS